MKWVVVTLMWMLVMGCATGPTITHILNSANEYEITLKASPTEFLSSGCFILHEYIEGLCKGKGVGIYKIKKWFSKDGRSPYIFKVECPREGQRTRKNTDKSELKKDFYECQMNSEMLYGERNPSKNSCELIFRYQRYQEHLERCLGAKGYEFVERGTSPQSSLYIDRSLGRGSESIRVYEKPSTAEKLLRIQNGKFGIWYDDSKWQVSTNPDEEGKIKPNFILGDGYAGIIAEAIEIPTGELRELALKNNPGVCPDCQLVFEEKRLVNGIEILCLQIEGAIMKIPITQYGYHYGGKEGTITVFTFTRQNLFAKYKEEFTNFLNGLVVLGK